MTLRYTITDFPVLFLRRNRRPLSWIGRMLTSDSSAVFIAVGARRASRASARLKIVGLAAFSLITACATSIDPHPAQSARFDLYAAPACDGLRISNKPDDAGRRLPPYTARGVQLVRRPTNGCLSSGFGPRRGGAGRIHEGVDFYTGRASPVLAAAAGRVVRVARLTGYGLTVDIDHGRGVVTRYAHLSAARAAAGRRVEAGESIGATGRSGNATAVHLHYEVRVDGRPWNPLARADEGARAAR